MSQWGDEVQKAEQLAGEHSDQTDEALQKGQQAAQKATGGRFDDQIDQGADQARDRMGAGGQGQQGQGQTGQGQMGQDQGQMGQGQQGQGQDQYGSGQGQQGQGQMQGQDQGQMGQGQDQYGSG
ncbi:MAG: antitoxin, partial [Actinocrinis sp.]